MNGIATTLHGFEFGQPWWLLALILPLALAWWSGRVESIPAITVPSLRRVRHLGRQPQRHRGRWRWLLLMATTSLLILAMARPRIPRGQVPDPSQGIDIMLTLDYSRSMAETDFRLRGKRISRKDALVAVTRDFVKGRPDDRIGIVCFARTPWLVSPLTLDHEWALASMQEAELATGTGIGWAISASATFLKRNSERSRIIILITDGDNSAGPRPLESAPLAVRDKIKVYTILIGPEMVTPSAAANHELNRVARLTGGQFFQANDARALEEIYGLIDQLEKRELAQQRHVEWQELYPWFILAGLAIWLGEELGMPLLRPRVP